MAYTGFYLHPQSVRSIQAGTLAELSAKAVQFHYDKLSNDHPSRRRIKRIRQRLGHYAKVR